jgi:pentatricopeptide repeat protein
VDLLKTFHEALYSQRLVEVMNAWVKAGDLQRAEQILSEMEKSYQDGGSITPSVISYTTLMNG